LSANNTNAKCQVAAGFPCRRTQQDVTQNS